MATEAIRALGEFYGTSLASRVSGYDRLVDRITYSLGAPMVNVELHKNQIYENITIAIEMFTKFAGHSEEHLIFDTKDKYEKGKGVRLDKLFGITPDLSGTYASTNLSLVQSNPVSLTTTLTAGLASGLRAQDVYTYDVSDTVMDPAEWNVRMIDDTMVQLELMKKLTQHHSPYTLQMGGLFHLAFGALLTGSAFGLRK